ncbi:concanavalin A-like lectin/glucanase domain-containing protein [Chaetomium tenue]|uniref:Concanavalin A-like lectin/glucanase domain-containing protein n=1 Tax=Chaetomium tenue TaxID=1854479 RepID=A0ACB7PGA4_9PEZI|nr:concanavalin A-like lectin/glucanase domain-containing protein [Chaetomium globosum]
MKATTLLTLLATVTGTTTAARLPQRATTRGNTQQQHPPYRLLHTLPNTTPGNARLLATSDESTQGGAILTLPPSSGGNTTTSPNTTTPLLTSISGTFRVPPARMPTSGPTANNPATLYAASFWIGVDSASASASADCGGGSLRAGVDIFWDGTLGGAQTPVAWFQGPGQVVVVGENFGGNVTCDGGAPAQRVRKVLPAVGGKGQKLCRREAAWVVEDFPLEGRPEFPVALADFGGVTFGAGVKLEDGSERDLAGAEVRDVRLAPQGGRLTSCEVVDGKKVKCARVVGEN